MKEGTHPNPQNYEDRDEFLRDRPSEQTVELNVVIARSRAPFEGAGTGTTPDRELDETSDFANKELGPHIRQSIDPDIEVGVRHDIRNAVRREIEDRGIDYAAFQNSPIATATVERHNTMRMQAWNCFEDLLVDVEFSIEQALDAAN